MMARPRARLLALALAGALLGTLVSLVFSSMLPSTIEVVPYVNGVLRPTTTDAPSTSAMPSFETATENLYVNGVLRAVHHPVDPTMTTLDFATDDVTAETETASEDTQEVIPVDFAVAGVVAGAPASTALQTLPPSDFDVSGLVSGAPGAASSQGLTPSNFDVSGANAGLPATTSFQDLTPANFNVAAQGPADPDAVASSALEPTTRINFDPISETEPVPYVNGVLRPTTTDAPSTSTTPKVPQGDVSCDGLVNVVDALFILQKEVGLRVDSGGCPLPPPPPPTLFEAAGDVNKDGLTNVVDALFILQCEVGVKPGANMPFC